MKFVAKDRTASVWQVLVWHWALAVCAVLALGAIGATSGVVRSSESKSSPQPRKRWSSLTSYVTDPETLRIILAADLEQNARVERNLDLYANRISELGIRVPTPALVLIKGPRKQKTPSGLFGPLDPLSMSRSHSALAHLQNQRDILKRPYSTLNDFRGRILVMSAWPYGQSVVGL